MRYAANYNEQLAETCIELASNCYTDSFPLLRRLLFRKMPVDLSCQSVALACAILTTRYCGDHFEYAGVRIGSDYAEAIRQIVDQNLNLSSVDGQARRLSSGEIDVLCDNAAAERKPLAISRLDDAVPLTTVTWSGDFVDAQTRSSKGFTFGMCHTNAGYFASELEVSVAVALLFGRDKARQIYVRGSTAPDRVQRLREALRTVAIRLEVLEPA